MVIKRKGAGNLKISTEKKIHPSLWEQESQRPLKKKNEAYRKVAKGNPNLHIDLQNVETRLNQFRDASISIADHIEREYGYIDYDILKERLIQEFKPNTIRVKLEDQTVLEYARVFLDKIEKGKIKTERGTSYSKGTVKSWKVWFNTFEDFSKRRGQSPKFDGVTKLFQQEYLDFLKYKGYETAITEADLELRSLSDIGKNIKNLKALCNRAFEEGLHNLTDYRKFKSHKGEVKPVVLTEDELERLREIKLEGKLDLHRDVFLCGCFTALRYSDYSRIKKEQIRESNGGKTLRVYAQKTEQEIHLPISRKLDFILKKYDYTLPKTFDQKLNQDIKEICKRAGIDELVEIPKTTADGTIYETFPKYQLVATHTARRTAATLMYYKGVRLTDIAKITGHSSEENLKRYLILDDEKVADILANNPFFQD